MMEKIQDLQNNVSQWEQSLNQEKQEQIESIRKTHSTQLEAISKKQDFCLLKWLIKISHGSTVPFFLQIQSHPYGTDQ